ncbi:hypothetical protein [Tropicibacter naphthalenivorans]|uniref:Uncharacterized protein n=1 Tax=Tropicibacter naphthalenivorans TaxID=441103 RepID=A0A0P1G5I1_9RHOB|nr:hypothetical protein [Tropicibacter naphthalenivorans]CUH76931.1 hypothetical protein TRN7648_01199 [Tropicibacter naphthalenivorans]SMC62192.1 hypothetical protein SAMN04488093_102419 [Tropicibacter naphthalenivorans]
MQISSSASAAAQFAKRPAAPAQAQPAPADPAQEIKRLVTKVQAAYVGAQVAPTTKAEAAAQNIAALATVVATGQVIAAGQAENGTTPGRLDLIV